MKSERIVPGLILVLLGTVFLLDNYHVIDFRWSNIWHLWPIFLIMGGVNLVFANNKAPWATALKIGVVILGFGLLVFGHFENRWFSPFNGNWHFNDKGWYNDNDDDDDDDNDNGSDSTGIVKVEGSSTYTEPYAATAVAAKLKISGGGTVYTLKDTTADLFTATTKERYNRYIYTHTMEGTTPVLDLHMKDKKGHIDWDSDSDKSNSAIIKLNTRPEWDIDINAGATALEFDLSKFKIKQVNINGGAGSFDIKLGQPLAATNVDVETGVSKVYIQVPQNAACRITSDSGLSSTDFIGFIGKGDNVYETEGFDAAKNKITIHMKGGLSKFKVSKY
jgi:hypothetical protein